jgi:hypothetical protein
VLRLARTAASITLVVGVGLSATACGGSSSPNDGAPAKPVTVTITEKDGKISPDDGHVVDVHKGQKVQIVVSSDTDDEIHVHSVPEHEFEVKAGASAERLAPFSMSTPGRFVVESHGLGITLLTLQVS